MKRSKRLKKKLAQWQCPVCGCQSGAICHEVQERPFKFLSQKFVWCSGCGWEYKEGK